MVKNGYRKTQIQMLEIAKNFSKSLFQRKPASNLFSYWNDFSLKGNSIVFCMQVIWGQQ